MATSKPSAADLDVVAAEQKAKEATSKVAVSLDPDKQDSLGNMKENVVAIGPRGADAPADLMTEADKQAARDKQDARLRVGMSSTVGKDSTGAAKGSFQVTPQGNDNHGMRLPDKVDYSKPVESPAAHVGPRGANAPQDCFHGARPPVKA